MFRSRRPENDATSCGATYFKSKHPLLWIDYILLRDYTFLSVADVVDVGFRQTAITDRGYKYFLMKKPQRTAETFCLFNGI
jgi:hypothetical protein